MDKYFGAYCAQCNVWLRKSDHTLLYYPSAALVQADLNTDMDVIGLHFDRPHLYAVTEFGTECPVEQEALPPGSTICRALIKKWSQQYER